MNGKDKISVIIPCYNVQKYIMRCFDSIYSQTYGFENLEVILIDDLSTDNTWSILESLQRQYPENVISLKIQKKGKCGGARNLGMDICTGKYITFVDADDYVHPDMLRVLYDRMTEDDYDVAQCGVSCFKADKPNVLEVNDFEIQRLDLDNVDNRKNLIIGLTGFTNVTAWAKLYSTKFIIEHNLRFIEDVYYEDTHFSMLCVLLAKKYCKVQSTLYYYFENTEGIIRSEISNAKIRDAKIIMDHIRQAIQSRKAELGNVIEQCYCEIQTFLLWHQYIEPYSRIETFMNRELDICKEEFLKSEPDIFNNPYVKFFSDNVILKRMSKLRVTAKKMDNAYFLDNAMHICFGIHDKDGNYSVWAGTTMQSIVENTKAPIVFHILHDDTLNEINKNIGTGLIVILFVNIIVTIKRISEIEYKRQKEESDRLRNQTERVSLQMMKTLAATIEAKDDYMRGHSYRVAEYSALIAKQLGWSEHEVENLRNAAYLHDIGKIGVPDTILNKPTRLTDEEFAAIKSHTVMGADILKDITLLDHLVDIARNHHERYDGKGYPDGLVGEEIPLSARIVCVADSYDAMKSRRIYRNALPDEEIRRELLDNCGTQFDPQISRMFVDMLDNGMVVIDEDNPAAQGYRDNAAIESVADKFISEVMKTMSSQEKADSVDYLTGLYMRSRGQQVIAALMQDNDGCLAFIDMDNLKKVNDVHGHKAGDRALKLIGNLLAKETENETFAACRLGGDEFLIFMPYSDRASVESVIKRIFEGFESAREADCEIKEAALSAGLCMTTKGAMFESDYTKADKALYYVKQNCKGSYFFYEQLLADNKENTNLSADLRNVAKLLKESGSYTGALDLNYREFARIYEFVNNVGDRHNHNCYLVMVTMNTLPEQLADIEEIEKALDCMEQSIRSKIRKVDVCTRYSSMQYLIILFEPQENQIPNVMERIFMHYYELCDRENFKPQYEYIKMTEVK